MVPVTPVVDVVVLVPTVSVVDVMVVVVEPMVPVTPVVDVVVLVPTVPVVDVVVVVLLPPGSVVVTVDVVVEVGGAVVPTVVVVVGVGPATLGAGRPTHQIARNSTADDRIELRSMASLPFQAPRTQRGSDGAPRGRRSCARDGRAVNPEAGSVGGQLPGAPAPRGRRAP